MLDEIESEQADEVDGEHLGAEGTGQFRPLPDPVAVGDAEFAVAVDRGGAHQIADRLDRGRVGLAPRGERGEHVIEEAHAAVGASEHELGRKIAPGLLSRHVPFEARDFLLVGHTVEEHEGRVPCFRDHAIRALLGRELVTEGDEAVGSALGLDRVDRRADTARVEIEAMPGDPPMLALHAPQQGPKEAQPRLMCAAEPIEPHHHIRRARRNFVSQSRSRHAETLRQTRWTWI